MAEDDVFKNAKLVRLSDIQPSQSDQPSQSNRIKGRISTSYDVWCGLCACWESLEEARNLEDASAHAIKKGWRYSISRGFICPACLKEQLDKELKEEVKSARLKEGYDG